MPLSGERKPDAKRASGAQPLRRPRVPAAPGPAGRRRIVEYLLVFVTVVLVVDALIGDHGLLERLRARREHQSLAATLEAMRQDNARLREDIRRYRDDAGSIESLAREELGLIKPGEVLFIIRDAKPAAH